MAGFLHAANPGDVFIFIPELLTHAHYSARMFQQASGQIAEQSDRYSQVLLYKDLAHICFAEATRMISSETILSKECN
jgi:hypothetical protein